MGIQWSIYVSTSIDYGVHGACTLSVGPGLSLDFLLDGEKSTYRKLVKILGTRSENSDPEPIHEVPQISRIFQRAPVVQNKCPSEAQATHKKIPHHPSTRKVNTSFRTREEEE